MKNAAKNMALGGVLAALAVVILSLGGMIPLATFCCPALAMVLLVPVLEQCGTRIAWSWYLAVAILGSLLCMDREAAAVFVFLGYYPILRDRFNRIRPKVLSFFCKVLFINLSVAVMYFLLTRLLGMEELLRELSEGGLILGAVTLLLGNVTFFLLDVLLGRLTALFHRKFRKKIR